MAARTLESRFERMSVNDENDPGDGSKHYQKTKVYYIYYPMSIQQAIMVSSSLMLYAYFIFRS